MLPLDHCDLHDASIESTDSQSWQTLHRDSNKLWSNRTVRFFGKLNLFDRFVKWTESNRIYSNRKSECTSHWMTLAVVCECDAGGNVAPSLTCSHQSMWAQRDRALIGAETERSGPKSEWGAERWARVGKTSGAEREVAERQPSGERAESTAHMAVPACCLSVSL